MRSLPKPKNKFVFGSYVYHYDLIRQNRKTLSLTVKPDLRIVVKCPLHAERTRINEFLRRKWSWLEKQLNFFRKHQHKLYQKEYLSGESFLYLGRQYKLIRKKGSENKLTLTKGVLLLQTSVSNRDKVYAKYLISQWYKEKMEEVFSERYQEALQKFSYENPPNVIIKDMRKRWGSFYQKNIIVLNPKLIYCSKDCIDYVIAHELCHVRFKNHDKNFYIFLKEKFPRWEKIKEKLESIGVQNY